VQESIIKGRFEVAINPNPQASEAEKRERFLSLTHALRDSLWRGDALGRSSNTAISSGYVMLDDKLPGKGWPTSVVTEVLWSQQGCGEIRMSPPDGYSPILPFEISPV
jgi:hypothetical protein